MTNIDDFDPSLLNIDEVLFESNELIMYDAPQMPWIY